MRGDNLRKLTPEQVAVMRSDLRPARVVAADYGVACTTVDHIRRGHTWKQRGYVPVRLQRPTPPNAKINADIAERIRADTRTAAEIAAVYSLDVSHVRKVRRREVWKERRPC